MYLVGGVSFDAEGRSIQSRKVREFDTVRREWRTLADMPEPRVAPVSPCPLLDGGALFVIGGYARPFPGAPREHPGFSTQTLIYEIGANRWANGPVLPHATPGNRDATGDPGPAPMIVAPGVVWRGHFIAISGEVRASVRTPAVLAIRIGPASKGRRLPESSCEPNSEK